MVRTDYDAAANRSAGGPPRPRAHRRRTTPVRTTLDLTPELHADFKHWCNQEAVALRVPDVPMAVVLRHLVQLLVTEDDQGPEDQDLRAQLAHAVRTRIQDQMS